MGVITKGGVTVTGKSSPLQPPAKTKNKKNETDKENSHDLSLTFRDVETLVILLQQVKISVGSYPYKELNQVGETISKMSAIYEHLKEMEI